MSTDNSFQVTNAQPECTFVPRQKDMRHEKLMLRSI
jgi:hypothetical protein